MESRHDSENAERILYNMSPKQLVCIWSIMGLVSVFFSTFSHPDLSDLTRHDLIYVIYVYYYDAINVYIYITMHQEFIHTFNTFIYVYSGSIF